MANLNTVVLIGRLTRDPELRTTGSGMSVTTFTLAIGRRAQQGKDPVTDYIPVVAWGKLAELIEKHTHKGSQIGIEGRIQSRSYQDKQGNNRTAVEVVADSMEFLDSKPKQATTPAEPVPEDISEDMMPLEITADDLPF